MSQNQSLFERYHIGHPKALVFTLAAILAIILLAAGLTGLELLPGEPEAFGFLFRPGQAPQPEFAADDNIMNVIRIVYMIGLILLPVWLIYVIINPEARKRFFRDLMVFGSFLLMILMLSSYFSERMQREGEEQPGDFGAFPGPPIGEGSANDYGGGPSEQMMWVASVVIALVAVGFLALVLWVVWRSRRKKDHTLERIAEDVQAALDELQSGGDLRNVVIRCYSDMVQALREKRGVHRNSFLTPREFEDTLRSLGFPLEPVHQLTGLFEAVRYGRKPVTRREELVAKDSLTAILEACKVNG